MNRKYISWFWQGFDNVDYGTVKPWQMLYEQVSTGSTLTSGNQQSRIILANIELAREWFTRRFPRNSPQLRPLFRNWKVPTLLANTECIPIQWYSRWFSPNSKNFRRGEASNDRQYPISRLYIKSRKVAWPVVQMKECSLFPERRNLDIPIFII